MILNTELSHDAEYLGDIQENRVGIDKSNLDFITTLLTSNLYSKPLESFLRETIANAYDSHIEAGTDEYILLLIQDSGHCNFTISIRDYGVGVSPERFEKIYRNIGSSTKRESNDYIGMFGIGRFSCLSCADVAGINSYYNGTKYSYIMYKNGGGINIDKISETTGDFKNGLEVFINKHVYYSEWISAINNLCLFEKLHITYKGEDYNLKALIDKFNSRVITHYKTFSRCSILNNCCNYFKVGNILYNIESAISLSTKDGLIIDLPIGSVDITPNREALQYTEYTKKTIESKVAETKKELEEIVNSIIKGDITINTFINQFCSRNYYSIVFKDSIFNIDKEDAKVDLLSLTIDGKAIPTGFDRFLTAVQYSRIDRCLIHKQINTGYGRTVDSSIKALILNYYNLIIKEDTTTRQVTWSYFLDNNKDSVVIITPGNLRLFKESIINYATQYNSFNIDDSIKFTDFLFSVIKLGSIANSAVPTSYIEEFKQLQKAKKNKTNTSDIPVRYYSGCGYTRRYFKDLPDKGLIIYSKHTQDDKVLRDLAYLPLHLTSVSAVITLKEDHLSSLADNKRFIQLEHFLYLRNKVLSKIATAKIIRDHFDKVVRTYLITSRIILPIRIEFATKYQKELSSLSDVGYTDTFKSIVEYYTEKGWLNYEDIKYFSLTESEAKTISIWDRMLDYKNDIIQNTVLKKYGKMPKIGLIPKRVPIM